MKKVLSLIFALIAVFVFSSCKSGNDDSGGSDKDGYIEPEKLARSVAEGSQGLFVYDYNSHGKFAGFGAECDPAWLVRKVGQQQTTREGMRYTPKASDWNEYILQGMKDCSLQRIRMMLLDGYFCTTKTQLENKTYNWDSAEMQDVYLILDTAEELGIEVNVTFWGLQNDWLRTPYGNDWVRIPDETDEAEQGCCDLFADAIDHLINKKGYKCIKDVTLFNEPNNLYNQAYNTTNARITFPYYERLVRLLDKTFKEKGLRNKVKFCMSDDAANLSWLEYCASELNDVCDVLATHTYNLMDDQSNKSLIEVGAYKYETIKEITDTYDIPVYFNEFGVNNDYYMSSDMSSFMSGQRGLTIARAMVLSMNYGVLAHSFWTFYSIHGNDPYVLLTYNYDENEYYKATQIYYAYSLLCGATEIGSTVYYVDTGLPDVCAIALKNKQGVWTYIAVNSGEKDYSVSFANCYEDTGDFSLSVYDSNGNYSQKEKIGVSSVVKSNGRIASFSLKNGTFAVLASK